MRLKREDVHYGWDNSLEPLVTVDPGTELIVEIANASGGQLRKDSQVGEVGSLDFGRVNPVTGPIEVAGADAGDALVVTIEDIEVDSWGWTANIPGFGLLANQFPAAHLAISTVSATTTELSFGATLPTVPMVGTLGVALPEGGIHSIVPPRRFGGNLDIRHLTAGATVFLPVAVPGALLSLGDAHAAMGDGEICGTGIEMDAVVRLRVDLIKGREPTFPILVTDPVSQRTGRSLVTTGIGPDLMTAARDAASGMIDEVGRRTGLSPENAYLLSSAAADLTISEIVDAPNWVVSLHLGLETLNGDRTATLRS